MADGERNHEWFISISCGQKQMEVVIITDGY